MAVLCLVRGWGGEGSGEEKVVRHSLLSFLLHHLPPPHVPHGGPFTSSTEVMMVQWLRGRSHRTWLQIPVHYGVTLGKLWNVFLFFFLRAPKIILFLI